MGGFLLHPDVMSNLMANAKMYSDSGLVAVKNPQAAAIIILKAKSLAMSADWGFANIHVINGRPCLAADGVFSLARTKAGAKFEMVESTAKLCRIKGTLPDAQTHTHVYTIEQAAQAGYTTKDNWKRMPTEMLVARCKVGLVRWLCPEVMAEMPYTREEILDFDAIPTTGRTLTEDESAALQPPPQEAAPPQDEQAPVIDVTPTEQAAPVSADAEKKRIVEECQTAISSVLDPERWPPGTVGLYCHQTFGTKLFSDLSENKFQLLYNVVKNSNAKDALGEFALTDLGVRV
jgi:hypothetical protein